MPTPLHDTETKHRRTLASKAARNQRPKPSATLPQKTIRNTLRPRQDIGPKRNASFAPFGRGALPASSFTAVRRERGGSVADFSRLYGVDDRRCDRGRGGPSGASFMAGLRADPRCIGRALQTVFRRGPRSGRGSGRLGSPRLELKRRNDALHPTSSLSPGCPWLSCPGRHTGVIVRTFRFSALTVAPVFSARSRRAAAFLR